MQIRRATLETCHQADDAVVVIDVLRAFTTTAFAFSRGAREILLVASPEEAFARRESDPDYLLMGEVDGLPIPGFDLPNSPAAIDQSDVAGRRLVMRSTAGTQGAVRATAATSLFVASLCVATATARALQALDPQNVTFVETGVRPKGGGEEDQACADYIAGLLRGESADVTAIQTRVRESRAARKFIDDATPAFPTADIDYALRADCFDFAMTVTREDDALVLRPGFSGD